MVGLWGCSQHSAPLSASARLRELEAKNARLEDDYKLVAAARDQARTKVEEQRAQLLSQMEAIEKITHERDDLKQNVVMRTAERDNVTSQLTQFGRDLQSLATKIELAVQTNGLSPSVSGPALTGAAATPPSNPPQE
jgi:chromosome segregation ATPase